MSVDLAQGAKATAYLDFMRILLALLLGMTVGLAGPAWAQTETSTGRLHLRVGSTHTVSLRENPSTGYRWRLAVGEGTNLAAVKIDDAGFSQGAPSGRPAIGAPGNGASKAA